jgi:hypothetical protein
MKTAETQRGAENTKNKRKTLTTETRRHRGAEKRRGKSLMAKS